MTPRVIPAVILMVSCALALFGADEGFEIIARCSACHGGAKPAAGLNLTTRDGALSGGKLTPKNASASRIYQLAAAGKMPPGSPLSKTELQALAAWIDAGAEWPSQPLRSKRAGKDWWSLRPLQPPPGPSLDAVLQARLSAKGLSFAPPASHAVLLRRATYDMHGLPPTPDEIQAFENDRSPDAWRHAVDRLLASPRYGERWARHWLDVARFCESQGYERDKVRDNIWQYRDYVIRAFNSDKPYSQFVREQIAGDVLSPVTHEGIAATAFLVAGPWDEVGNEQQSAIMKARVREDEYEDLIGTVSQTFLGLTTNCARCHDHKFDPILQRDYYGMKAIFAGISPGDRPYEAPQDRERRLAAMRPHLEKLAEFDAKIRAFDGPASPLRPDARFTFNDDARDSVGAMHGELRGGARIANGKLILANPGQSMKLPPTSADWRERTFEAWVKLADLERQGQQIAGISNPFDRLNDGLRYGVRRARQWGTSSEYDYRTLKPEGQDETAKAFVHVAAVWAADHSIHIYRNGAMSYAFTPAASGGKGRLQNYPAEISQIVIGGNLVGEIDEIRLYRRALNAKEIEQSYQAGPLPARDQTAPAERAQWIAEQTAYRKANLPQLYAPPPTIFTFRTETPPLTNVLERGDPAKPAEPVEPHFFTLQLTKDATDAQRRAALADWILTQPIAARVIVNRVWHYHFGRGLAATPNDFGFNGEAPSHPELIDWLASKFVTEDGWSIKKLHRRILLSEAYRQSGRFDAEAQTKDPENRLYWRFPARRLEGEAVRDAMLQVTGMLNPEMFGPSFKPFDVTISNSHFYTLKDSDEAEFRRRSIYRMNVLSARLPLLESLDCPDPAMRAPARGVTTTPLQALGLMNNAFVLRYAGHLAKRATQDNPTDPVRRIWQLALGRDPSPAESKDARQLIEKQGLASLAWAVFNSNEFVYVE